MEHVVEVVHETDHAVEDEDLAVRCATATLLITAPRAADVETLARRIHAASAYGAFPFVQVSAAALPGRATMLIDTCARLLAAANGGSLLLTDVEHMPRLVQHRLLGTLAEVQRARHPSRAVRLMAGTTASLCDRIADGTFSQRLFYRLNTIHIVVTDAAAACDSAHDAVRRES